MWNTLAENCRYVDIYERLNVLLYAVDVLRGSQAAVKDSGETFEELLGNTPSRQY